MIGQESLEDVSLAYQIQFYSKRFYERLESEMLDDNRDGTSVIAACPIDCFSSFNFSISVFNLFKMA